MALKEQIEKQGNWLFRFRGTLPVIILILGIYEYYQTEIYYQHTLLQTTPYEYIYGIICLAISILGLGIRVYTVGHTPDKTSGRNVKEQIAEVLNTTGIYSVVRNPLYVGNFFMWLGIGMITANFWFIIAFILFYWIYYERIVFAEEQFLSRKFGEQYDLWAAKTPCFIPSMRYANQPATKFSWRKVIMREKNGLVALLMIFSSLDIFDTFLTGDPLKYPWLGIITIASMVMYVILKYIKHRTRRANKIAMALAETKSK